MKDLIKTWKKIITETSQSKLENATDDSITFGEFIDINLDENDYSNRDIDFVKRFMASKGWDDEDEVIDPTDDSFHDAWDSAVSEMKLMYANNLWK